jgi:hypothetical protein
MVSVTFKPCYPGTVPTGQDVRLAQHPLRTVEKSNIFYPCKWPKLHLAIAQTVDFSKFKSRHFRYFLLFSILATRYNYEHVTSLAKKCFLCGQFPVLIYSTWMNVNFKILTSNSCHIMNSLLQFVYLDREIKFIKKVVVKNLPYLTIWRLTATLVVVPHR